MKELRIRYSRKDFRVDTFCSGGPGGQNQNKRKTGVRITHIPSGLSSESREQRSQGQNKKTAFSRLAAQVVAWVIAQERPREAINTTVIRTYHAPDNRVKDHASGLVLPYDSVMYDIGPLIDARRKAVLDDLRNV